MNTEAAHRDYDADDDGTTTAAPPDFAALDTALSDHQRQEVEEEARRAGLMEKIAGYRWEIAQRHHRLESGEPLDFDRYPFQRAIYNDSARSLVVMGSVQWGKALPLDSRVLTCDGWKRMGDIQTGDRVIAVDGTETSVTGVYPQGTVPIHRITFKDGRTCEACGEHLWEVFENNGHATKKAQVLTTRQVASLLERAEANAHWKYGRKYKTKYSIVLYQPNPTPEVDLPLDPYVLGALLGDGSIATAEISLTSPDPELVAAVNADLPSGVEFARCGAYGHYLRGAEGDRGRHGVRERLAGPLRDLGLLGTDSYSKFIPQVYKHGSIRQRLALVQGMMDTDGYASKSISYSTSSERLAKDLQEIIWSLGGVASIGVKERPVYTYKGQRRVGKPSYKLNIRFRDPKGLFRLQRKRDRATGDYRFRDTMKLAFSRIEYVSEKPAQCIRVDHPRHLYVTDNYVVTHNSEFLICTAASMAACGLKVFYVLDKYDKRDRFVAARITPTFNEVPLYRAMIQVARDRSAKADSARFKAFGPGSINFVGSNSPSDFSSYAADASINDEHQLCDSDNVAKIFHRLSGSPWRFQIIVGNPRIVGTADNQNLDWEYQQSDQRRWHLPCEDCGQWQVLGWWSHFIREDRNKAGAITNIEVRDADWRQDSVLDIRPMCTHCRRPMNRLSRAGDWKALNPGHLRHGFQLSNLNNPNVRVGGPESLLTLYQKGLHSPTKMADFVNDQLGMAWSMEGSSVTDRMLSQCSTGELAGLPAYGFLPADALRWAA